MNRETQAQETQFICKNIGISGTTPCHVRKIADDQFEARMGFALMGATNMDEEGFKNCNYDPFHPEFYDNFCSGTGPTPEDAVEAMKKDMSDIGQSLWI